MILHFDRAQLGQLLQDFYTLTGIRIVLYDKYFHKILAYPEANCAFCAIMHDRAKQKCQQSNIQSFNRCIERGKLQIYRCHAGLIEATAPIKHEENVIAYMILGQLTDQQNRDLLEKEIESCCKDCEIDPKELSKAIQSIKFLGNKEILAASKIMEACASYILYSGIISIQKEQFIQKMDNYINDHIQEDIKIETLCREFHVTRTKLYNLMERYLMTGIATYVRKKRMETAMYLLRETNESITEISSAVGFPNYNYFCQVFKKETGLTAKEYHRKYSNDSGET